MALKPNPYPLRVDEILMEKFKFVAAEHKRSVNKEIEMLVELAISQFEEEHGEIFVKRIY